MSTQTQPVTVRHLLAIPNFRLLWLGQIISDFGDSLTYLTLVLLINRVTGGSTTAIAYLLIALALPQATIGLLAGVFVDRLDRKRIMVVSDFLRGILVLGFILISREEGASLLPLYLIAFLHSTVGAFFTPARGAVIPHIVPAEGLLPANSLAQMSMVFFRLLGTAAAGFLVGVLEVFWPAFVVDALTFFISMVLVSQLRLAASKPAAATKTGLGAAGREIAAQLGQGLAILFHSRVLVGTLVAAGVTMLGLGAINVLLAPLLVNELLVPETWFGALELAQVAGMILSGMVVAGLAARVRPTRIVSGTLVVAGVAVAMLSLIQSVWHLMPLLFIVGLMVTPLQAAIATLVQVSVQDEARGRIGSALGAIINVANLVSMFAAGTLAAWIGTRSVFTLGGALTVLAGLAAAGIFRGYRPAVSQEEVALQSAQV